MVYTVYSLTSGLPGPAAAQAGRPAPGLTGSAPPPPIRVLLQRGHRRRITVDRREGKDRRCCLRDILECRSSHLAARMILRTVLDEHPFWEVDGLVWCELEDHPFFKSINSPKCPFFYFFKSSWRKICSASWNLINSVPQRQRRPLPYLLLFSSSMNRVTKS